MSMIGCWVEITPGLLDRIIASPSILDEVRAAALRRSISPDQANALLDPNRFDALMSAMPAEQLEAILKEAGVTREAYLKRVAATREAFLKEAAARGQASGGQKAEPDGVRTRLNLDKTWHGIHFLLCRTGGEAPAPLGNAVLGGTEVGPDQGYGPVRYLRAEEVAEVATAVSSVDTAALRQSWEPQALAEQDIYPGVWEEDESREWLLGAFAELQGFYAQAASRGSAVLLYLT